MLPCLEQAHRSTLEDYVHRTTSLGAQVMINVRSDILRGQANPLPAPMQRTRQVNAATPWMILLMLVLPCVTRETRTERAKIIWPPTAGARGAATIRDGERHLCLEHSGVKCIMIAAADGD